MLSLRPLAPDFGVEVDADISRPLSDEQFAEIERAFYASQVLAIRSLDKTLFDDRYNSGDRPWEVWR